MLEMDKCPQCKGEDIKKGVMHAAAVTLQMVPANKPKGKSSPISAEYCNDCGYIASLYVVEPKNLE
ncbi:acetyltransferase [Viridibacillus sp. YIM B01967]|uniref:Acetyltransferase n=1 Tax=Viridibacillus soli TaxID=2798301 RepID=A0ABS1H964_9BACL|nr:acetyltransferase [Viridibacillus soli]MBK3495839.1 acetyltransferase [Viridibacillus soli]